ncbi:MAG: DUF3793 family protein [Lachnospiraceae bacterium]|nr:DUF3793 family protein [Lachnospiraceae bacterium]
MSEELIIEHCSPTLAGMKSGSMFSVKTSKDMDIYEEVRDLNKALRKKGLRVIPLRKTDEFALIYIYRPKHLEKDLKDPRALRILKKKGYETQNPECCIAQLVRHIRSDEAFPHEIGLFLGYPPSDVESFIKHPCTGVKCCGYWKAYSNPEKAQKKFVRFRKCTEAYHEMNKRGKSLAQLAVYTD